MPTKKIEAAPQTSSFEPKAPHANGSKPAAAGLANPPAEAKPEGKKTDRLAAGTNPFGIPDWRLEQPPFYIENDWVDGEYRYKVVGDTKAPVPPLRPSKYLSKEQSIEILRYMIINRRMEQALEAMYKQSKVIGGLYLSL